jgi:hypothetical protein
MAPLLVFLARKYFMFAKVSCDRFLLYLQGDDIIYWCLEETEKNAARRIMV